jgi:hypothetical protein
LTLGKNKGEKCMAVSISQIRKDVDEIKKTLGDRIILYADNAVEITRKVNEIIGMFRESELFMMSEPHLAEMDIDRLINVLKDATNINIEYEKFLKTVGLLRIN